MFSSTDHSDVTLLCLLDCSKCFNVIPHDLLLCKLNGGDVPKNRVILKIFQSFWAVTSMEMHVWFLNWQYITFYIQIRVVQNFIDLGRVHHIYFVKSLEVIKVTPGVVTFESVNFEMILEMG